MSLTRSGSRVTAKAVSGLFRYLLVAIMASPMEKVYRCGDPANLTLQRLGKRLSNVEKGESLRQAERARIELLLLDEWYSIPIGWAFRGYFSTVRSP